jgi:hypothetical protein
MEFTVTIEPEVIDILGTDKVSAFLRDAADRLKLKAAAQEALTDANYFDQLINDPEWQVARRQAWEENKYRYLPSAD